MHSNINSNLFRYDGIQVLRVLAALLVVITHSTFYAFERLDSNVYVWRYGSIGVDIFFIISGFIMISASGIASNKAIKWTAFIKNRLVRIIPMYWLATILKVVALIIVPSMVLHAVFDIERIFYSFLLLPQVNPDGRYEPLLGVGWTLIYEMFFYVVFTLALFLKINPIKFVSTLFIFFTIFGIFYKGDLTAIIVYTNPIILYFVLGMFLFYLNNMLSQFYKYCVLMLFTVLFFILICFDVYLKSVLAFLIFWLFLIIEPYIHGKVPKVLLFLGEVSYVLYLFHPLFLPIIPEFISKYSPSLADICVLISIPIALIVASIIHMMIEKPSMRLIKNSIFKK